MLHAALELLNTKQNKAKEGEKIPPTPGFEPQVIQCLVGVLHHEGWIFPLNSEYLQYSLQALQ